ncbi:MAG: hypothetical protein SVM80_11810 [Halobacteriota archaeon]|nr:hypothetical protein [Halobacteriota archaeon]
MNLRKQSTFIILLLLCAIVSIGYTNLVALSINHAVERPLLDSIASEMWYLVQEWEEEYFERQTRSISKGLGVELSPNMTIGEKLRILREEVNNRSEEQDVFVHHAIYLSNVEIMYMHSQINQEGLREENRLDDAVRRILNIAILTIYLQVIDTEIWNSYSDVVYEYTNSEDYSEFITMVNETNKEIELKLTSSESSKVPRDDLKNCPSYRIYFHSWTFENELENYTESEIDEVSKFKGLIVLFAYKGLNTYHHDDFENMSTIGSVNTIYGRLDIDDHQDPYTTIGSMQSVSSVVIGQAVVGSYIFSPANYPDEFSSFNQKENPEEFIIWTPST